MEHTLNADLTFRPRRTGHDDALVRLPAGTTIARHLAAGTCIAVQRGRVWVTQTGDANDYFVGAGERHVVACSGRVVIEGDSPLAALKVTSAVATTRPGFP